MTAILETHNWKRRLQAGKKHENVINTFRILDGKPQENGRFGDLGNNRRIILIICLVELKCDINPYPANVENMMSS